MTIQQIVKDTLTWCRYFAVNNSVGEPEVLRIFYEAYQDIYEQAVISHPEFFFKSAAFSGTSWTIPADFYKEIIFFIPGGTCVTGYVRIVDNSQWDVRESAPRNAATAAAPAGYIAGSTFVISPSCAGTVIYIYRPAETVLSDTSQAVTKFLPLIFQPLLLAKMQELVRVRHFNLPESSAQQEEQDALADTGRRLLRRKLQPLEILEGITESPLSVEASR